jgi:hypothetical protein
MRRLDVLETTAEVRGSTLYNLAALHSESEYIVFLGADAVLLDENWIEEFILLFERREQLLMASPRIEEVGEEKGEAAPASFDGVWDWNRPGFVRPRSVAPYSVPYQALTASPTCFAVHRERFLELGGFDRTVTGGDPPLLDLAIHGWLAGYEVFCHPRFRVGRRRGVDLQSASPASDETWAHYSQLLPVIKYFTSSRRIEECRARSPAARGLLEQNRLFLERRRRSFLEYARFDDDWLFYKFGIKDTGG